MIKAANNRLLRTWGDTLDVKDTDDLVTAYANQIRQTRAEKIARGEPLEEVALALSGGGPDGAFGAGLVAGWTARGDRPEFSIVTGISTGAIIAVFAFLGPEYDDELKEIYTGYTTEDLLTPTIFAGLTGGTALSDNRLYRGLIERYIDEDVVARLAEEAARGRTLLVGTTNLDAARPVIWSLTNIAATGDPNAKRLIHDIIQASSAIPAAFPPVIIPVEASDGTAYDEMHVDGGATQQVMLFSPELPLAAVDALIGAEVDRSIFVVINNKLQKSYAPVRPRVASIAGAAVSSLLGGSGTGDIYKIYAIAQRDNIDLNVAWIPKSFDEEAEELFDPAYMGKLYELGYEFGLNGEKWLPRPPDFRIE
ncbi:MAG: patatin-like phospholipase family protein [Pseudomonadota bacterium]